MLHFMCVCAVYKLYRGCSDILLDSAQLRAGQLQVLGPFRIGPVVFCFRQYFQLPLKEYFFVSDYGHWQALAGGIFLEILW